MMIPHHEAAIAMAQQAIITTQHAEIAEMQGELRDWYGATGQ
jgi:uncharacterized protein (DUF305 family)